MSEPEITCRVTIYERDGEDAKHGDYLLVESHWASRHFIVLTLDGKTIAVDGETLREAAWRAKKP